MPPPKINNHDFCDIKLYVKILFQLGPIIPTINSLRCQSL